MDSLSLIKYPIYIISKGRWEVPLTARFLMKENIPFQIAVEPQEFDLYKKTIPEKYISKLPFSNLGLGSYPARNWCWEDSIQKGYDKHFLFDDNIRQFYSFNNGIRSKGASAVKALISLQNFTERYKNIGISGYNYVYFVTKTTSKPFVINSHVYSGMLINNHVPFRWRLKYNEDVDLCLAILDAGYTSVLYNYYIIDKVSTVVKMKGGNQTELYKNNDHHKKILKSRSLEEMWPQYVKTVMRFNRPHHQVSWQKHFKQPLIRKKNFEEIVNEQKKYLIL